MVFSLSWPELVLKEELQNIAIKITSPSNPIQKLIRREMYTIYPLIDIFKNETYREITISNTFLLL